MSDEVVEKLKRLDQWYKERESAPAFDPLNPKPLKVTTPQPVIVKHTVPMLKKEELEERLEKARQKLTWLCLLFNTDLSELRLRHIEERCMNCGIERGPYTTFWCSKCYKTVTIEAKRAMRTHNFDMGLRSMDQMKENDRRRKEYFSNIKNG